MKLNILIPTLTLLWLWWILLVPSIAAWSAQGLFLGDKHKNRGIDCSGCHRENPPKQAVLMDVCMGCHGDYRRVAARTAKLDPNPHDSHLGSFDCGKCHHSHKASVNACAACHSMDMSVP